MARRAPPARRGVVLSDQALTDATQGDDVPSEGRPGRARAGGRSEAVALVIVALLVAALGFVTVAPRPSLAGFLGLAVVAICLTALAQAAIRGPFAPVALTFWAFVAVWVGIPPLLQLRADRLPWADTPLTEFHATAQVILLVALVTFWIGYTLPSAADPARPTGHLLLGAPGAVAVTAATVALAVVSLPVTGGLAVRFTSRDGLREAIAGSGLSGGGDQALAGLLGTLPAAASLASLVLCLRCVRFALPPDRRSRVALFGATGLAVLLNVVFNNPLSASRFASFSVLLAAALCLVDLRNRGLRLTFTGGLLAGLALVYPLANLFRNQASRERLRLGLEAYYTYDFDGFQQTVNSVSYVEEYGHTWGHHAVSALLFWVPRSAWEGKAFPAGIAVADARGYGFTNLSLPLWAELYVEYSWIGVAVLMFCYGLVARRLDLIVQRQAAGAAAVLATVFAGCQIGLVRGPAGAQLPFAAAALLAALAGAAITGGAARRRRSSGMPCTD